MLIWESCFLSLFPFCLSPLPPFFLLLLSLVIPLSLHQNSNPLLASRSSRTGSAAYFFSSTFIACLPWLLKTQRARYIPTFTLLTSVKITLGRDLAHNARERDYRIKWFLAPFFKFVLIRTVLVHKHRHKGINSITLMCKGCAAR